MKVLIVEYNAGNIHSIRNALHHIGVATMLSSAVADFQRTQIAIFPGVGNAASAMADLKRRGLDSALRDFVNRGGFLLGICVGAQLLFERSEEENTHSLGFIPGRVRRLPRSYSLLYADTSPSNTTNRLKVPHIGWNYCSYRCGNPLFYAIPQHSAFYFVHSYYCAPHSPFHAIARSNYGIPFASAIQYNRMFGVQFHPEKSGRWGLQLLRNFVRYAQSTIYRERGCATVSSVFSLQSNRKATDGVGGGSTGGVEDNGTTLRGVNAKVRRLMHQPQRINAHCRYLLTAPWYDAIYHAVDANRQAAPNSMQPSPATHYSGTLGNNR